MSAVTITSTTEEIPLSSDEKSLLQAYRTIDTENRNRVLTMAQFFQRIQLDFQWEQEQLAQRMAGTKQAGGQHA